MRSVKVIAKTKIPAKDFWEIIINVRNWSNVIKFVRYIKVFGEIKEGSKFYDVTSIMFFPVIVYHKITKIEKYRRFYMQAYMPFKSGIMYQTIDIEKNGSFSNITLEIKFKINFFLFDFIFGSLLEKRLKIMIVETLEKIKKQNSSYGNSEIIN